MGYRKTAGSMQYPPKSLMPDEFSKYDVFRSTIRIKSCYFDIIVIQLPTFPTFCDVVLVCARSSNTVITSYEIKPHQLRCSKTKNWDKWDFWELIAVPCREGPEQIGVAGYVLRGRGRVKPYSQCARDRRWNLDTHFLHFLRTFFGESHESPRSE